MTENGKELDRHEGIAIYVISRIEFKEGNDINKLNKENIFECCESVWKFKDYITVLLWLLIDETLVLTDDIDFKSSNKD